MNNNNNNEIKLLKKVLLSNKEFISKNNNLLKKTECGRITKNVENVLYFLYDTIIDSILWTNNQINSSNIIFNVEKINEKKDIEIPETFNEHFYPKVLRENMMNNAEIKITTNFKIRNIKFKIILITSFYKLNSNKLNNNNNNLNKELKYLFENIKCMISWLNIATKLSGCSKNINNITIYFYKFENNKQLPEHKSQIISPINVNSAYANVCEKSFPELEIVLFRSEEWFKVFIHETFHCFNLTISPYLYKNIDKLLKQMFDLNIDYNIGESYADFWARIINICYSVLNSQIKYDKKKFLFEFEKQ